MINFSSHRCKNESCAAVYTSTNTFHNCVKKVTFSFELLKFQISIDTSKSRNVLNPPSPIFKKNYAYLFLKKYLIEKFCSKQNRKVWAS